MKMKTLAVAAGVSAPLIMTAVSDAGFVGVKTTWKKNNFGLLVVNFYAVFDRPGEDHMVAVTGTPKHPLFIKVLGGTLYNHSFGSDLAPNAAFLPVFPSLAFDTFVTIGKKNSAGDTTLISPGFPPLTGSIVSTIAAGWSITPDNPQGNPFDPANSFPGNSQILIAQFSTADGIDIKMKMVLQFVSNGEPGQVFVNTFAPAPGALALLGFGGLICARRRRR